MAGGIGAFELTLNDPGVGRPGDPRPRPPITSPQAGSRSAIGAGTVLSVEAARRAVDAGASFLVAPHLDAEVVAWAATRGMPMLPGAATPTEVLAAWRAGAAAVKVFPASVLGPAFLRELRGPFPDIPLQPTGGISVETAGAFIEAGAIAVGIGSWLFADRDPAVVTARARRATAAVAAARSGR